MNIKASAIRLRSSAKDYVRSISWSRETAKMTVNRAKSPPPIVKGQTIGKGSIWRPAAERIS